MRESLFREDTFRNMCVDIRNKHPQLIQDTSVEQSVLAFSSFMRSDNPAGDSPKGGGSHTRQGRAATSNKLCPGGGKACPTPNSGDPDDSENEARAALKDNSQRNFSAMAVIRKRANMDMVAETNKKII